MIEYVAGYIKKEQQVHEKKLSLKYQKQSSSKK